MRIIGIDLAGSSKNNTGLCILDSDGKEKKVKTLMFKGDSEILLQCDMLKPDLIAIDAPLTPAKNGFMRLCDEELREYGALPQSLRGMTYLVERGITLGNRLKKKYKVIEVYNAATAKILGFYDKNDLAMQKKLAPLIDGDIKDRVMKRDELDAITAALMGFLHSQGKASEVGGDEGKIAIPKI